MALRTIVLDGDPILKKNCRPVTKFDDRLGTLLDDMAETVVDGNGLGLAGPQVGVMRRVFVMMKEDDLPEDATEEELLAHEPVILEFVNPEILEKEGEVEAYEGCLSFPGKYGAIKRPERVKIKAQDREGNEFTYEATGYGARCLCHETNHLDGVTIDDLAEYFYDPEVPHELDETVFGAAEEDYYIANEAEGEG